MTRILGPDGTPLPTARERAMDAARKQMATRMQGSYDAAALASENQKHWRWADHLSASEANSLAVRRVLRSRSRYECLESNSFATGIVQTLATDFVTTGPGLQIRLKGSKLIRTVGEEIEAAFRLWAKRTKLNKKLWTARLAKCIDGEAFLVAQTNPRMQGPVQLDVRLVECDQISTPGWFDGALDPHAVDGMKFDEFGNVTEYQMLPAHPGSRYGAPLMAQQAISLDPNYVVHLYKVLRPGQWRGVPEVTTALPLFAMLRRYTLATILAAETAADFAVVLKTMANMFDDPGQSPLKPFDAADIDRGMMAALPYGYEMQQMKAEQPTTTYEVFRNAILQEIARCISMPTNKARGDSSGYNYSSSRLDHQMYYHAIDVERGEWEIDCMDRVFGWWLDEALLANARWSGALPPMEELAHRWTWRPAVSVNPLQDAQAAIALRDAGLMTEEEYFERQQLDPDYVWLQRAIEWSRRAALGEIASSQNGNQDSSQNGNQAGNQPGTGDQPHLEPHELADR